MRAIPASMDPTIVAAVDARLDGVESEHAVTIPWAIESGSRAWGFPSPDSDYDCRFFYIRHADEYLSPWPKRDVIETPLDKIFDVNGWDLAKALRLLVKGNATVTEWLRSPIIYRGDERFREEFLELAASLYDPVTAGRHYLHVGRQQAEKSLAAMTLKRVFYSLRPAATLRWLRDNPGGGVPPMDLGSLLDESTIERRLRSRVNELVALKSQTREVGSGAVPSEVTAFIADEFAAAGDVYESADTRPKADAIERCEAFFVRALHG
ncbi:MAG: nucleotidyltransferase domain-containing protein [Rhodoglobus sp.]|nr:nucleotidyltransferase domain-containing protein [Rhodoglobus sp.]